MLSSAARPRLVRVLALGILTAALVGGLAPEGRAVSATSLRRQLEETADRIHRAEANEAKLKDQLRRLQRSAARDATMLKRVQARVARRARLAYVGGLGSDPFEVMVTSDNPTTVIDRLSLLEAATRGDREQIRQGVYVRRRLDRTYAAITDAMRRAGRARASIVAESARLRRLLAAAGRSSVRRTPRASRSGGLPRMSGSYACLVGPNHAFRDTWGAPRSGGRRHKGVDVFAPYGSPSYAVTSGRVTRASYSRAGGLGIYLMGDDGNEYYYAHMSSAVVRRGRVSVGQLIAYVGDSGNARGTPHVHFEVHPGGGSPVNPYPFVARIC